MKHISIKQAKKRAKLYLFLRWAILLLPSPSIVFGGLKYFAWYFHFISSISSFPLFKRLYNIPVNLINFIYNKTNFLSFFWNLPPTPNPNDFNMFNYYYWLFLYGIVIYISTIFKQRYQSLSKRLKKVEQESEENNWKQEFSGIQPAPGNNTLSININLKSKNDFVGVLFQIIIAVIIAIIARIVLLWFGLVK